MVRHEGFGRVRGSVPKKYVGMDRCVVNINFSIMLKSLKINVTVKQKTSGDFVYYESRKRELKTRPIYILYIYIYGIYIYMVGAMKD